MIANTDNNCATEEEESHGHCELGNIETEKGNWGMAKSPGNSNNEGVKQAEVSS